MKQVSKLAVAATFAFAMGSAAYAETVNLTLATNATPELLNYIAAHNFAKKANELSGGKLNVVVNESLLKGNELGSAVRDGRVELVIGVYPYLSATEPLFGLQNLPGIVRDEHDYKAALDAFWHKELAAAWDADWNAKILVEGIYAYQVTFTNKPVHSVEDFRGLKLRVHNAETARFASLLGALPTPMDPTEISAGLERGIIDGLFTTACFGKQQGFWRVANNLANWQVGPIQGWAILVNKSVWADLDPELQAVLEQTGKETEKEAWDNYASMTAACIKAMQDEGVEYYQPTKEQFDEIFAEKNTKPVIDDWIARADASGRDGNAVLKQFKDAIGD
jgi:TRAP-type C4-dicarboxylate transport system substrate-binding protein